MATDLLRGAASTGDWARAADWALRRALATVEAVPVEQEWQELRGHLQEALEEAADPRSRAARVAAAYDLLVDHRRLPEDRAEHLEAGKDVRDALILCCVQSIGTHSDYTLFDSACSAAFGRQVPRTPQLGPQGSLYAQLHHSYQQLFKHVDGRFISSSKWQGRRRVRRSGAPPANWEPAPEAELDESAGESSESAPAEPPAQWSAGGASPATLGAALPCCGAARPARVPVDLQVPKEWRQGVDDLLEAVADRGMKAEVVHGSVERLGCRLKEIDRSCYDSTPGQRLCSDLLGALSCVIMRFPKDSHLHAACVDVLLSMCVRRGDILGLQAPDISQEQTIKHLCLDTQGSVKEAIDTAIQACSSDETREELMRLLVRTQPVSVVLGVVGEEGWQILVDEARYGLSWCFDSMEKQEFRECCTAFFKEVMNQCQERKEFLSMHNWVRGGSFDSRYHMRDRFVVIGLLFGISTQILAPLPKEKDANMIIAALKALALLDGIASFGVKANAELVRSIQELGGKASREAWAAGGYSELWMECEAEYASVLGRLLQGSSRKVAVGSYEKVDWTIQEACAIVEHAASSTEFDGTPVLHAALWCLAQVFEGASGFGDWDEIVGNAERQARQYASWSRSSTWDLLEEADRLVRIRCGERL